MGSFADVMTTMSGWSVDFIDQAVERVYALSTTVASTTKGGGGVGATVGKDQDDTGGGGTATELEDGESTAESQKIHGKTGCDFCCVQQYSNAKLFVFTY